MKVAVVLLYDRTFYAQFGGASLDIMVVTSVKPQGSVLGMLFLLFVSDLSTTVSQFFRR